MRKYSDISIGTSFGTYVIVSEPILETSNVQYRCRCSQCKEEKVVEARDLYEGRHCKCVRLSVEEKRKRHALYQRQWRQDHPGVFQTEKYKAAMERNSRKYLHGISQEEFDAMLDNQGHMCYICGKKHDVTVPRGKGKLHVDHNHLTGKIRGLLCHRCNAVLGFVEDNESILLKATEYLRNSK